MEHARGNSAPPPIRIDRLETILLTLSLIRDLYLVDLVHRGVIKETKYGYEPMKNRKDKPRR